MTRHPMTLSAGPPSTPRVAIGVAPERDGLKVVFSGECGGRAEILTLAQAEALAEGLLNWVDVIRYQQIFGVAPR